MSISLRVLTFNIRKGLGASGLQSQLVDLRDVIRQIDADVVFLQEVMGESRKAAHRKAGLAGDQLEYLADSVWTHFAYGKNAVHSDGHHGNAILSKYPIARWENIDISTNPFEQRGLLHALIEVPGHRLHVDLICLHLNLLGPGRTRQLKSLIQRVRAHIVDIGPLLIAGDFNDWSGAVSKRLQKELVVHEAALSLHGQHHRTFPAWLPLLPLDRIYFRGLELLKVEVLEHKLRHLLSDHQAIVAEFKLARNDRPGTGG
ncbi:MAG: endonuclease/exonuclease/phosphatase family protein [Bdellovibrionales bacterium]